MASAASHIWRKPKNEQDGEVIVSTGGMAYHGTIESLTDEALFVVTRGGTVKVPIIRIKHVTPKMPKAALTWK